MGASIGSKNFYICLGSLPRDEDIANITGINGEHLNSRNNADVEAIRLTDDWLTEVPFGIDNFFPNILLFYMTYNPLKTVNSNQLQQFPNLEYLWLHENQIETIEVNAFTYTPALRAIRFSGNKLETIPYNVFQPLYLKVLRMSRNICITDAAETPEDVNKLIAKIDILCSPLGAIMNETLNDLLITHSVNIEDITTMRESFEKSVTELKNENEILKKNLTDLDDTISDLKVLEEAVNNFTSEITGKYSNANITLTMLEDLLKSIASIKTPQNRKMRIVCDACDKIFHDRLKFIKHRCLKYKTRNYKCNLCEKATSKYGPGLKRHIRQSHGEK
ncbi:CLUMA_CG008835, isoform A [Clunio marinus]|uniref:CLUMA_CG008835, isoform A n=1 Tax=Clunio marinus TaxID=568069 RepID=A0A1J1I8U8_9DIPT|nr:CLUMA_CG008835, isoform A [Clunio marinus]